MEIIPRTEFGRLRLVQFVADQAEVEELEDWEYDDRMWVGEAIGFTEFLRHEKRPDVLGCISLDLEALPQDVWQSVFNHLRLPLKKGLDYQDVTHLLGEPKKSYTFVPEQKTYDFVCGSREKYRVSCTIHLVRGLKFVNVISTGRHV